MIDHYVNENGDVFTYHATREDAVLAWLSWYYGKKRVVQGANGWCVKQGDGEIRPSLSDVFESKRRPGEWVVWIGV